MKNLLPLTFFALVFGLSNQARAQCKPTVVTTGDGHVLQTTDVYLSYRWVTCPGFVLIPGAYSQSYYVDRPGSYAVIVEKGSCTDTSDCMFVNPPTGIAEEAISEQQVSIAPNPSSGPLHFKAPAALQGAHVVVYSLTGQMETAFTMGAAEKSIILNPGWHFITIGKEGWRETHKVLIVE